jgi:versiconal hemiacetal acetate esterase
VEYRLAPEFVYPAGLDDCVAGYKWALENATTLKTTPGKAITFGTSAGGGLAISTALRMLDAGLTDSLVGVVAITPVTCHPDAVPKKYMSQYTSYDENSHSTINSKAAMKVFSGMSFCVHYNKC